MHLDYKATFGPLERNKFNEHSVHHPMEEKRTT